MNISEIPEAINFLHLNLCIIASELTEQENEHCDYVAERLLKCIDELPFIAKDISAIKHSGDVQKTVDKIINNSAED